MKRQECRISEILSYTVENTATTLKALGRAFHEAGKTAKELEKMAIILNEKENQNE